ncbi:hypothetical protein WJ973_26975 [Achromobacter xylosoxidans]
MADGESLAVARVRSKHRYSMRTGLLGLVVACIAPALVVASIAVYESYLIQKERIFATRFSWRATSLPSSIAK